MTTVTTNLEQTPQKNVTDVSVFELDTPGQTHAKPATSTSVPDVNSLELDYLCHCRILSTLSPKLYDTYCITKTSYELWTALEDKYGLDDVGLEHYTFVDWLEYKMVEMKSITSQILEYTNLVQNTKTNGFNLEENILAATLIEKLPPS